MSAREENPNDAAFRRGRWLLVAQGIVCLVAGVWTLIVALSGISGGTVFGVRAPAALAGIVAVTGLVSLAGAMRQRAGALLVRVQAPLFLILFMVSAATRHSGVWQTVFGYDAVASLAYLVLGLLGLILVMWLSAQALGQRGVPRGTAHRQ